MDSHAETGSPGEEQQDATQGRDRSAGFGKNRIEALTDGIFAIALTLLVLGVEVPQSVAEIPSAAQVLISLLPDFFHYVLAFVVLGVLWVFHHQQFHHILHIDRTLLWLNILTLMFVAMVPFSSDFADTYFDQQVAGIFFAVNLLIIGILIWIQWEHAIREDRRLVSPHLDPCEIRFEQQKNMIIPGLGIFSIALSLAGIIYATGIFYALPVILYGVQRWHDRSCPSGPA